MSVADTSHKGHPYWYTVPEIAAIMQVSKRVVRNWIRGGKLESVKQDRVWYVRRSSLIEFVEKHYE